MNQVPKMQMDSNFTEIEQLRWPDLMIEVREVLYQTLVKNFATGGRPDKWEPKKTPAGGQIPSYRGSTISRLSRESGTNRAQAGIAEPRIYDFANEFGASPKPTVTDKSKKFFWRMYFLTGNEMWMFMALKKVGSKLYPKNPPRPAMKFQEEDKVRITEILRGFVFKALTPKRSLRRTP